MVLALLLTGADPAVATDLGRYGQLNLGTADFDDVTPTEVDAIPSSTAAADFAEAAPATSVQAAARDSARATDAPALGPPGTLRKLAWGLVGLVAWTGLALSRGEGARRRRKAPPEDKPAPEDEPGADRVT